MSFSKKAECIRKVMNNSSSKDFYKFDKKTYNASKIKEFLEINSPKLAHLIKKIKELDDNDMAKYGKKFKHIVYSDLRNSIAGIKLVASAFKAYGMNNIYNEKFKISIPDSSDNFALLSSVAVYEKPFPVKLRKEIIKIFNERPDNINGEKIRFLLIDQGFKEGIDCFDVKYVHLFDDLITPADQKQAIGRGTRFCGQKGLEFNSSLGWPLHVFKYKLRLNEKFEEKFDETDAFMLFLKESKIDIKKLYFSAELENICRFGAVDYEINKAIHEFGNDKEDDLNNKWVFNGFEKLDNLNIPDAYGSMDRNVNDEFPLLKKAYGNFGGIGKKAIAKKTGRFIDIKKVKSIGKILKKKLGFIEMRKYIRRYFNELKWKNLEFKNVCDTSQNPSRIVSLNNSQQFVSNFFTSSSVYKGMLFWHSVGTGKTCSAIATASNSFEKDGYTILWVTRHTLKPDIWKNMYKQICSHTIREKLENGIDIPEDISSNYLKYLDGRWVMPISYKQFSNLIAGKNEFYKELVKRNGKEDPLRKTLIIIDEAHKIFAEDVPKAEKPDVKLLKKAIYKSYEYSKEDSCKLILMTATPYTNDPIQLFKLINLLKEDNYFPEDFEEFKDIYLDDNYKFEKSSGKHKQFLDEISGYISYLNREKDVRQFAYPVIYLENVKMSSKGDIGLMVDVYETFMDEIKEYIDIDLDKAKEIIQTLKEQLKEDKKNLKKPQDNITQEEAFITCLNDKKKKKSSSASSSASSSLKADDPLERINKMGDYVKEMTALIKEKEKEAKKGVKKPKKEVMEIIDVKDVMDIQEIYYQIDAIVSKYQNGEVIKPIGVRTHKDNLEDFTEIGEILRDNGLDDAEIIKNTKKECVLIYENLKFTITYKIVKDDLIYTITPSNIL